MDGALTPWDVARRVLPFDMVPEAELFERISTGRAHLWVKDGSAAVTEVTDGNMLRIWAAGGDMPSIMPGLSDVEAFARNLGCKGLELEGRRGWLRVLSRYDFVFDGQRLVKWLV